MLKTNTEIATRARQLQKMMSRIEDGFRYAKAEALTGPDLEALEGFRLKTKVRFLTAAEDIGRELRMLRSRLFADKAGLEETTDLLNQLEKDAHDLQARLVSTPSRLIRLFRAGVLGRDSGEEEPDPGLEGNADV